MQVMVVRARWGGGWERERGTGRCLDTALESLQTRLLGLMVHGGAPVPGRSSPLGPGEEVVAAVEASCANISLPPSFPPAPGPPSPFPRSLLPRSPSQPPPTWPHHHPPARAIISFSLILSHARALPRSFLFSLALARSHSFSQSNLLSPSISLPTSIKPAPPHYNRRLDRPFFSTKSTVTTHARSIHRYADRDVDSLA